jgi:hypothetical protein
MSQGRWNWQGLKDWVSQTSRTRPARFAYSAGTGCGVASSIAYIGTALTACFTPPCTCCLAGTACVATTAIRYNQLDLNEERMNEVEMQNVAINDRFEALENKSRQDEKHIQLLEEKIRILTIHNQDILFATQQHNRVFENIIPTLTDPELQTDCREIMDLAREDIDNKPTERPTVRTPPSREHKEVKSNPYAFYSQRVFSPSLFKEAPPDQVFDDDEDADEEATNRFLLSELGETSSSHEKKPANENTSLMSTKMKRYS